MQFRSPQLLKQAHQINADLKTENYQLNLDQKEKQAQIELLKKKLIDQNTELQYTRKYFAGAPPEVNEKLEHVRQQ